MIRSGFNAVYASVQARLSCALILLCAALLCGCASDGLVRGRLNYDLRPEPERSAVHLPAPPDEPRYRYAGTLLGAPNFVQDEEEQGPKRIAENVFKWLVGLFENNEPLLLQRPMHGATSDDGRIYVVDAGRSAVVVFDPNPPPDDDDSKHGQMLVWEQVAPRVRLGGPVALAIAWDGEIAVSDVQYGAVLRLNRKGALVGVVGQGDLKRPAGLAFDRDRGLLYVADAAAHDVKAFDSGGRLVRTIGSAGDSEGLFNAPTFLSFSGDHLYVSDTLNNRVQVFDAEGRRVSGFGERGVYIGNFTRPKGVAVDAGIVYVAESYFGYLLAYDDKGKLLLAMKGNGMQDDKFILPTGVWTDKQGRVYVADMLNARVVVFQFLGNTTTKE
ncbi:MAG: 6-bladed beta-propeller [Bacillota bacterium]